MNAGTSPPAPARIVWRWYRSASSTAPVASWAVDVHHSVLQLSGDWRRKSLPALRATPSTSKPLRVDGRNISASDGRLGPWLWPLLQTAALAGREVELQALPPRTQALLELALQQARREVPAAATDKSLAARQSPPSAAQGRLRQSLHALNEHARLALRERVRTLGFIGAVLLAAAADVPGAARNSLRTGEMLMQFEQAGPRSLPIVLLVSGLIGLILAYMGGAQLRLFGAQSFVAPLVAVGELREIAALAVGIVLSGRVGAAYAAQLATMRGSEEIDALRAMGVDPVQHLVLPRLAALLLAAPLLTAMAAAGGMAAGWAVAVGVHDVAPRDYVVRSLEALSVTHLAVGLFKGTLYGLLVGLAGCRQGLHAERSAAGVGQATTGAVVQAIVWVTVAASLTTVLFEQLGW